MPSADGLFVLPPDVKIRESIPADRLPPDLLAGDCVISRPGGRVHPRLISPAAARFLEFFREPILVETAIVRYCEANGGHPADVLSSLVPLLCDLMNQAYLVPPESAAARTVEPALTPGRGVGGFEIVRCLRASIDTEVYQVRHPESGQLAALKIESPARLPSSSSAISREAEILQDLGGGVTPGLLARGELDGAAFLLAEWCEGRSPEEVSAASRYRRDLDTRRASLATCCQVLEAYAELHAAGILHGDVQPSNIILSERGPARLVDFESAVRFGGVNEPANAFAARAGQYIEPELAAAIGGGEPPPPCSAKGEQYLIAAVLYRMLTGDDHLELSVIESELLRRLAAGGVRSFRHLGHPPWTEVEEPLRRALSRDPEDRFDSVEELRSAIDYARRKFPRRSAGTAHERLTAAANRIADRYVDLTASTEGWTLPSEGFSEGLASNAQINVHSLALGSGGVALGLLEIASNRSDPALLAAADVWLTRSLRACGDLTLPTPKSGSIESSPQSHAEMDFNVPAQDTLPASAMADGISLFCGTPGLHFADTLLAIATGDRRRMLSGANRFLKQSAAVAERLELYRGRAGTLLGLSLIQRACDERLGAEIPSIRASGDRLCDEIVVRVAEAGAIGTSGPENLGVAHGWAGILYSIMCWRKSTGRSSPDPIRDRLDELARWGETWGTAIRWPWIAATESGEVEVLYAPGWCNGSAGFVHLWTLASELEADPQYIDQAVGSARSIDIERAPTAHLCCGASGEAYALLRLFRVTQDEAWLERARQLMKRTIEVLPRGLEEYNRASLYRGELGVAVAASEFASPEDARMPVFA